MGSCFLDIEKMRKPVVFMIAFAILIDMNYFAFAMPYTFNQHRQPRSQLSQLNQLIQDSESAQLVEIWKRLLCRRMLKLSFKFLCRDHGTTGIRGVFGTPFF